MVELILCLLSFAMGILCCLYLVAIGKIKLCKNGKQVWPVEGQ